MSKKYIWENIDGTWIYHRENVNERIIDLNLFVSREKDKFGGTASLPNLNSKNETFTFGIHEGTFEDVFNKAVEFCWDSYNKKVNELIEQMPDNEEDNDNSEGGDDDL